MYKFILNILVVIVFASRMILSNGSVNADSSVTAGVEYNHHKGFNLEGFYSADKTTFTGLTLGVNLGDNYSQPEISVNGLNITLFNTSSSGNLNGISLALLFGQSFNNANGIATSMSFGEYKSFNGIAVCAFLCRSKEANGIQLGLLNVFCSINGIGAGLVNMQSNLFCGTGYQANGIIIGIIGNEVNVKGLSFGLFNKGNSWLQVGLLNIGNSRVQIGLINLDGNNRIKFPFLNIN